MCSLCLLGFADRKPAGFIIDKSYPHSSISEAFLFQNNINTVLDSSGCNHQNITLSVPSLGGYYTSPHFPMQGSILCNSDMVLSADWLSQCQPTLCMNAFGQPVPDMVDNLTDGHTWTADGTCSLRSLCGFC